MATTRRIENARRWRTDRIHGSLPIDLVEPKQETYEIIHDVRPGKSLVVRLKSPRDVVRYLREESYLGHELISIRASWGTGMVVLFKKKESFVRRKFTPGHWTGD